MFIFKFVVASLTGTGSGIIIKEGIAKATPTGLNRIKKLAVWLFGMLFSMMVAERTGDYAAKKIDGLKDSFVDIRNKIKELGND